MGDMGLFGGRKKTKTKKVYFDDLQKVGKDKPLGYLPLDTIRGLNHEDPLEVMRKAKEKDLYAEILQNDGPDSLISGDGWLFVADLNALGELLEKNADILNEYGWSRDPKEFIKRITTSRGLAFPKTKLFDLIADAYGDLNNPGRTNIVETSRDN